MHTKKLNEFFTVHKDKKGQWLIRKLFKTLFIFTGRSGRSDSGYEEICGNCRDPCQLKFTPDKVPRYLQRLATQNLDEGNYQENDRDAFGNFEVDDDYLYDDK